LPGLPVCKADAATRGWAAEARPADAARGEERVVPHSMTGRITLVQEHRFKLVDDRGVAHLFVLAHDAPLEGPELEGLQATGARVRVAYGRAPNLIALVAHDVTLDRHPRSRFLPHMERRHEP
jgi:hypothetical protein